MQKQNVAEESVGQAGERVRRFDSKRAVKAARKEGIAIDPDRGIGIPATTTDVEPVDPDTVKIKTGANNADHFIDIDIEGKRVLRRQTKEGHREIVIQDDISPQDIVDGGRTRKSRLSPDQ